MLLLSPGTSHCAQRRGPHGQDGPRMGWLCWSDTLATSLKSTRWAGEWYLCLISGGHRAWQPEADHCHPPRTKIFIRFPKTLFATEDALEVRRQSLGEREAHSSYPRGSFLRNREEVTAFGVLFQEVLPPTFSWAFPTLVQHLPANWTGLWLLTGACSHIHLLLHLHNSCVLSQ